MIKKTPHVTVRKAGTQSHKSNDIKLLRRRTFDIIENIIKVEPLVEYSRVSCQPVTSAGKRLCNHLCSVFLWNEWRHRLLQFLHQTHYLSNRPQTQWKTDIPCRTVISIHSHNTNKNSALGARSSLRSCRPGNGYIHRSAFISGSQDIFYSD